MAEKNNAVKKVNDLFFKVRREEVDSHLQDFMTIYLDLACMKLSDIDMSPLVTRASVGKPES